MNTATATTAELTTAVRLGQTAAAGLDLADVDKLTAGYPAELVASIREQITAARTAEAALGAEAEAELQRRRLAGHYGRTVNLPYVR